MWEDNGVYVDLGYHLLDIENLELQIWIFS